MKKIILLLLGFTLLIGCATMGGKKTIYPTITYFIGSSDYVKYKSMAILPFADAPNSPNSGQIVQGLTNQIFAQFGFDVIERARLYDIMNEQKLSLMGLLETQQTIEIGKLLGVKAIVIGEVGQYETMQRKTDTTHFPLTLGGKTTYIPIQGQQWMESYVSVSLRIIDIETGQLIFSGSGQYDIGVTNPPQQSAEYILRTIIKKWIYSQ